MTKETLWLIVAGAAAILAVPLLYVGLQDQHESLVTAGFALFTAGMLVTPLMKLVQRGD